VCSCVGHRTIANPAPSSSQRHPTISSSPHHHYYPPCAQVNHEYDELRNGLAASTALLLDGGRTAILTWKHTECAIVVDFSRRFEVTIWRLLVL